MFFLIVIFSCEEQTIEKYNTTDVLNLRVHIAKAGSPLYMIGEEMTGKLRIEDISGEKMEFDIRSIVNNKIEVPFGFYKAIVNGFENCNYQSFDLISTGGNKEVYEKAVISQMPALSLELVNHEIGNDKLCLLAQCEGDYSIFDDYGFIVWGTNQDTNQNENSTQVFGGHRGPSVDGKLEVCFTLNSENLYKYYNLTIHPIWGKTEEVEYNNWYELK